MVYLINKFETIMELSLINFKYKPGLQIYNAILVFYTCIAISKLY